MVYSYSSGLGKKRFNRLGLMVVASLLAISTMLGIVSRVSAEVNAVTPSTNEINKANGWAYAEQVSKGVGTTDIEFVSTRNFYSCFEYRTDGDISQKSSDTNYNTNVTDGLYPYTCVKNDTDTITIPANSYVEVRMVFGAETDERFDWTRFDVLYNRTAEITAPTAGQNVYGSVDFAAYLDDNDVDGVQWAVRQGTCAAGVGTVYGNVDGHHDVAAIDTSDLSNQTFMFTADMSSNTPGTYCFVYNPSEDSGETNIRLTQEFNLLPPLTDKMVCKQDGWMSYGMFKNQGECVSYVNHHDGNGQDDVNVGKKR